MDLTAGSEASGLAGRRGLAVTTGVRCGTRLRRVHERVVWRIRQGTHRPEGRRSTTLGKPTALLRCRFLPGSSDYAPGVDHASPPDTTPDVVRHPGDGLIGWAAPQAGPERG
jgi:hypothetical protein